eukprot:gene7305-14896_t
MLNFSFGKPCFILGVCILASTSVKSKSNPLVCRDPYLSGGQSAHEKNRKFAIFSTSSTGGGMGNELIFFPAAYFYAALTGRDIIIHDDGLFAELCQVVMCGFPTLSQMSQAFPKLLGEEQLKNNRRTVKTWDMMKHFSGEVAIDDAIVYPAGYVWKSNWWLWMNGTNECIKKITGCDIDSSGDVTCAENYAYQTLIRGPFRALISSKEEGRITGIPSNIRHGLLTLPYAFAPRLDLSIHLRAQFHHFEQQKHHTNIDYVNEVSTWLNSSQGILVFDKMEEKVVLELKKLEKYNTTEEAYIYIAADNEEVKDALIKRIEINHPIKVMRIETAGIVHTKNLHNLKNLTAGDGMFDMVFDWYSLSLSNVVLAWRRDAGIRSTFIQTAGRVSNARIYYLDKNRHGEYVNWNG